MLICATGQNLRLAYLRSLESLDLVKQIEVSGLVPLAAFGWVIATHLSLYPAILIIPFSQYKSTSKKYNHCSVFSQVIFLLGCGPDAPPRKLFLKRNQQKEALYQSKLPLGFSWRPIIHFAFWALLWSVMCLFFVAFL
ncbi:hypothetical protein REPUB_Repub04eG0092600 [Reevesia pubescens]